ncbi:membrane protein insertion efficiency factor YidD [Candidatus Parcubacteria bacterium]|nr:membrane protein insertion efficiency factor YidD [Candidatus Parcubacteria bacterium]
MFYLKFLPKYILIRILKFYQKTISFDHGFFKFLYPNGYCKYYPTCSNYAISAIEKYGFVKGGLKSIWRVLRCNPWSKGGYDPVD